MIIEFGLAVDWVESLKDYPEKDFFEPTVKGKWSVSEIIAHLAYWDSYVLEEILPRIKQDADIKSIEFQKLNDQASEYALSGVSEVSLIDEFINGRKELVAKLNNKSDAEFFVQFKINGEEIDPYAGSPFSIYSYISSFIWHDHHHKNQIVEFFNSKYAQDYQVK
ncbi:DinB family protein [Viridibacillus sp. YIM B01967]|uniref:DinB family protein n=1 Tax=Viridibacillus soli TaxID=2798301 RepID=A0ABS1H345_9BACL|nr:DinB family protein [Viridibacillus soli]